MQLFGDFLGSLEEFSSEVPFQDSVMLVLDSFGFFHRLGIGGSSATLEPLDSLVSVTTTQCIYLVNHLHFVQMMFAYAHRISCRFISIGTMSVSEYALKRSVNAFIRI